MWLWGTKGLLPGGQGPHMDPARLPQKAGQLALPRRRCIMCTHPTGVSHSYINTLLHRRTMLSMNKVLKIIRISSFLVYAWKKSYLWAGGPSIIILIHKICMALRGLGKFIKVANEIKVKAAILLLKKSQTCQQILILIILCHLAFKNVILLLFFKRRLYFQGTCFIPVNIFKLRLNPYNP